MQPLVEFTVKGLESPLYMRRLCSSEMYLYPHQVNMLNLWSKKSNLLLTTGTGSGKTAAVLFPLIKGIEKKRVKMLFLFTQQMPLSIIKQYQWSKPFQ